MPRLGRSQPVNVVYSDNSSFSGDEWRLGSVDSTAGGKQDLLESGATHHIPTGQTARVAGTTYILGLQYNATTLTAYLNGAVNGSALSHSFRFLAPGVGHRIGFNGSLYYLDGKLCELVIVDADLTSGDRTLLDNYGNAKWSVF